MEKKHYCKQTPKGEPLHCDFGFCHSCNSLPPVASPTVEEKQSCSNQLVGGSAFTFEPTGKESLQVALDAMMLTDEEQEAIRIQFIRLQNKWHAGLPYADQTTQPEYPDYGTMTAKAQLKKCLSLQKLAVEGKK